MAKKKKKESYTRENRPKGVSRSEWDKARKAEGKDPYAKFFSDPVAEKKAIRLSEAKRLEADKFIETIRPQQTQQNPLLQRFPQQPNPLTQNVQPKQSFLPKQVDLPPEQKAQADSWLENFKSKGREKMEGFFGRPSEQVASSIYQKAPQKIQDFLTPSKGQYSQEQIASYQKENPIIKLDPNKPIKEQFGEFVNSLKNVPSDFIQRLKTVDKWATKTLYDIANIGMSEEDVKKANEMYGVNTEPKDIKEASQMANLDILSMLPMGGMKNVALQSEKTLAKSKKIKKLEEVIDPIIQEARKYKSAEEFVKAQGKTIYHGTSAKFDKFDDAMKGSVTGAKSAHGATWFTDNPDVAKAYSIYAAETGPINKLMREHDALEKIAQRSGKQSDWAKVDKLTQQIDELGDYDATYQRRLDNANVKEAVAKGDFYKIDAKGKTPQELSADGDIDSWLNLQVEKAKKFGKDGLIIKNIDDAVGLYDKPSTHYAIFDSSKIKTKQELTDIWNKSQPLQEGVIEKPSKILSPKVPQQIKSKASLPMEKPSPDFPVGVDDIRGRGDIGRNVSYEDITNKQRQSSTDLVKSQGNKIADDDIRIFREQNLLDKETVDEIILRKRGVVTDKEAVETAKRYKMTIDDIVNTPRGTVPTKEKMTAMSQVIQEQREINQKLRSLAEGKGKASTPEERKILESMGLSNVSEDELIRKSLEENIIKLKKAEIALMAAKSEAGRSLQGAKQAIDAVDSRMRIVYGSMKNKTPLEQDAIIETIAKYPIENDKNFIKLLDSLNDADIFDKVAEFSVAAKLWNTTTHIVNTTSNILRQVVDMTITDITNPSLAKADTMGAFTGLKSGLRSAYRAMTDEGYASQLAKYAETGGKTSAIKGFFGKAVRTPFRLLGAGDEIFKGVAYQRSLYRQASRLSKGDATKMKSLLERPTFDMMEEASNQAKRMTYQEEMGEITSGINKFRDPSRYKSKPAKAMAVVVRSFLSFLKTPTNLLKQSADFSPLGFLKNGKEIVQGLKAGGAKGEQARRLLGEATVGTGLAIVSWEASGKDGIITGNAPKDPKERDLFYKQGKLPYSIKIGGRWYQYKRVEPFSTVIGAVADMHDLVEDGDLSFGTIVNKITGQLKDKTYLQGMEDLMNLLTGEKWEQEDAARNMILGSTIPSILGHTARSMDENIRATDTLTDKIKSQIPFVSDKLETQHDFFGEEKKRQTPLPWVNPIASADKNDDPILSELKRLEDAGFNSTPSKIEKNQTVNGEKIELTPKELSEFEVYAGEKAKKLMKELLSTDFYKNLSDEKKQSEISRIFSNARAEAKVKILGSDEEVDAGEKFQDRQNYYEISKLPSKEQKQRIDSLSDDEFEAYNRIKGSEAYAERKEKGELTFEEKAKETYKKDLGELDMPAKYKKIFEMKVKDDKLAVEYEKQLVEEVFNEYKGKEKPQWVNYVLENDKSFRDRLKAQILKDKRTNTEETLAGLGVENMERANAIWSSIKDMPKEEQIKELEDLKKKKILTSTVLSQLKYLRANQ